MECVCHASHETLWPQTNYNTKQKTALRYRNVETSFPVKRILTHCSSRGRKERGKDPLPVTVVDTWEGRLPDWCREESRPRGLMPTASYDKCLQNAFCMLYRTRLSREAVATVFVEYGNTLEALHSIFARWQDTNLSSVATSHDRSNRVQSPILYHCKSPRLEYSQCRSLTYWYQS